MRGRTPELLLEARAPKPMTMAGASAPLGASWPACPAGHLAGLRRVGDGRASAAIKQRRKRAAAGSARPRNPKRRLRPLQFAVPTLQSGARRWNKALETRWRSARSGGMISRRQPEAGRRPRRAAEQRGLWLARRPQAGLPEGGWRIQAIRAAPGLRRRPAWRRSAMIDLTRAKAAAKGCGAPEARPHPALAQLVRRAWAAAAAGHSCGAVLSGAGRGPLPQPPGKAAFPGRANWRWTRPTGRAGRPSPCGRGDPTGAAGACLMEGR